MVKTRSLSVALAASLLLIQAGSALAQTPEPIERTAEMETYAADIAAWFPETVGGASLLDNLEINVGQEILAELDPSDDDDAAEIAEIQEFVTAAGATLDDTATATSYALLDEDTYVYVVALQIRDGDVGQVLPLFVSAFEEDIPDAVVEQGQVGDEDVTTLRSGADSGEGSFTILVRGDILWLLSVPPELLEETVASLPES